MLSLMLYRLKIVLDVLVNVIEMAQLFTSEIPLCLSW